jgi:hypothetical protein
MNLMPRTRRSPRRSRTPALSLGVVAILAALPTDSSAASKGVSSSCTFHGHKLYGRIQVVQHFPDVKVQVVEHFPDVRVQVVEHFPSSCGKWQMVEHFPDTKVQLVQHFPDVKIQYVKAFPGLP